MFDKKKFFLIAKIEVLVLVLVIMVLLIPTALSKYTSTSTSDTDVDVAFYLLKTNYYTENIALGEIIPRVAPYVYNFNVSNTDGTNRAETNLRYDLSIRTTTNLPLTYELYLNEGYNDAGAENIISTDNINADDDGTFFRVMTTDTEYFTHLYDETNQYQLVVYFPQAYKNYVYQNIYDSIEVTINSKQVVNNS